VPGSPPTGAQHRSPDLRARSKPQNQRPQLLLTARKLKFPRPPHLSDSLVRKAGYHRHRRAIFQAARRQCHLGNRDSLRPGVEREEEYGASDLDGSGGGDHDRPYRRRQTISSGFMPPCRSADSPAWRDKPAATPTQTPRPLPGQRVSPPAGTGELAGEHL